MFKLVAVSAALIATTAAAQTPANPPPSSNSQAASASQADATSEAEDPNEVICRNVPVVGSRVNRMRVCRSRAEWTNAREVNRGERSPRRGAED
jgi:hypothetical protein